MHEHDALNRSRWKPRLAAVALLAIHGSLLALSATLHSPSIDEVGHMAAGLSHWKFGRFDLYHVNPPLARLAAAAPVLCARPQTGWDSYSLHPGARSEFTCGEQFIAANGRRSFWLFTLARWACVPFSVLGGWVCYRWAGELYGARGGLLALALWCFCPNVLAHAQMITPDVPAAALGASACHLFWRWLREPTWRRAFLAGLVLGLAELTKTTFLAFYALWPVAWLAWRQAGKAELRKQATQLALMAGLSLYLLNVGYAFEGSFQPLGGYHFISRALGGPRDMARPNARLRNRFADTPLAAVPVPLPANYLLGIDAQKFDFEVGYDSYLRGEWRHGGWWYYYLYGLAVKVPLGTWLLLLMALRVGRTSVGGPRSSDDGGQCPPHVTWRDEFVLLLPAVAILALVSSQTGFNHHLRYVLPIFPFVFIWIGRLGRMAGTPPRAFPTENGTARSPFPTEEARSSGTPQRALRIERQRRAAPIRRLLIGGALAWSVASSLWYYPHSLSYFNELAGGPLGGPRHLLDSNIDWGQDVLFFKRWLDQHPEARPLGFAYFGRFDPRVAGIEFTLPPLGPGQAEDAAARPTSEMGPKPGWYAVSVMMLHGYKYSIADGAGGTFYTDEPFFTYFQHFQPVARAGYSIYIYHIDLAEANRVRRLLGLPPLPSDELPNRDQGAE